MQPHLNNKSDDKFVSDVEQIEKAVKRYQSEPTISSQLPVSLSNGFTFTEISMLCPFCGSSASSKKSKGTINQAFKGIIMIDAYCECDTCTILFPYIARLKERNNHFVVETIKDNEWVVYDASVPLWRVKLWHFSEFIKKHLRSYFN